MELTPNELRTLTSIMRGNEAECAPVVTIHGSEYRLLALYDGANPAILGLKVHDNRPAGCRLTLMTSSRFCVPTPGRQPDIRHRLTIHDLVDLVANGPTGKSGYTATAWPLLQSIWNYGVEPLDPQLATFVRQTANTGAIMQVFDSGICFQSVYWSVYPQPNRAAEILARVVTAYLVARDEAAMAKRTAGPSSYPRIALSLAA